MSVLPPTLVLTDEQLVALVERVVRALRAAQPPAVTLTEVQLDELAERITRKLRASETCDQDNLPIGVTRRVYLRAARAGKVPTRKVGRKIVSLRADLDAWIASRPAGKRGAT